MPQEILNKRLNHYWGMLSEPVPPLSLPRTVGLGMASPGGGEERGRWHCPCPSSITRGQSGRGQPGRGQPQNHLPSSELHTQLLTSSLSTVEAVFWKLFTILCLLKPYPADESIRSIHSLY